MFNSVDFSIKSPSSISENLCYWKSYSRSTFSFLFWLFSNQAIIIFPFCYLVVITKIGFIM